MVHSPQLTNDPWAAVGTSPSLSKSRTSTPHRFLQGVGSMGGQAPRAGPSLVHSGCPLLSAAPQVLPPPPPLVHGVSPIGGSFPESVPRFSLQTHSPCPATRVKGVRAGHAGGSRARERQQRTLDHDPRTERKDTPQLPR